MTQPADVYARWSALLAKIRARVDDICAETEAGATALIASNPRDPLALKTAMQALNARVDEIERKIERTWNGERLDSVEGPGGVRVHAPQSAYDERHATEQYVQETWTRCKMRSFARFLRAMWPLVDAEMRKEVPCAQCGASLRPARRDRVESLACPHCHALNQVLPDVLVMTWFNEAPAGFALERHLEQRLAVLRAAREVERWREAEYRRTRERPVERPESRQRREQLARAYHEAFVSAKAEILPATAEEQAAEIERLVRNLGPSLDGS